VKERLIKAHGYDSNLVTIVVIKTTGDQILDRPLSEAGGKGLFTKEIEEALLSRDIDLAVHSMKDMQTVLPEGLLVGAVLEREDVRDAFISLRYRSMEELPEGAVVGTSSLRREAQLRSLRPDLNVV
jgi:hydroxymethylbilane synthase